MRNFYNEFKTPIITLALFFLGLFLYTRIAGPISFSVNNINTNKTDFFTAQGMGEVSEVPDSATAYLGITTQGKTALEAQNKANEQAAKIISAIKSQGISDKDIKTTNYSINPNYGIDLPTPDIYPNGRNQGINGYTVSQNFEVKITPIDKLNKVVDAATQAGANQVQGANFTFSDDLLKKLENEARKKAVSQAKEKAQGLANAAGIRLGKVINVIESSQTPFYRLEATGKEVTDTTPQTNITPGQNTVIINVTIYYETY